MDGLVGFLSFFLVLLTWAGVSTSLTVTKCCQMDHILYQSGPGKERICKKRRDPPIWSPKFFSLDTLSPTDRPPSYALEEGIPKCGNGSSLFGFSHHENSIDDFKLFHNGSLYHRLMNKGRIVGAGKIFDAGKYCVDDILIGDDPKRVEFAYVCLNKNAGSDKSFQRIFEDIVYPIGLAVSMLCLILTFLLYFFLPQLRDLTGKFILGICLSLIMTFSLTLVDIFGWKDANVEKFTVEILFHVSIGMIWFCLSCMGHHTWKIIKSKSVFTRVTDGQRLLYYSLYCIFGILFVTGITLGVHFLAEKGSSRENYRLGWGSLGTFYAPIAIILVASLYFYWTSMRRIRRQLIYNKSMQHFQVNFDLFVKFFIVIGVWWIFEMLSFLRNDALKYISMIFNIIQGPLIFCIAMCRTRVAFLFKKYFCYDSCCFGCCKSEEFIEEDCQELATIDVLRDKEDKDSSSFPNSSALLLPDPNRQISRSLFNIRNNSGTLGKDEETDPLKDDEESAIGRVSRLLKSNSMNAILNANFGWRKETSV